MNTLTTFAQYYTTRSTRLDDETSAAIAGATLIVFALSAIITYVIYALFLGKIFKKSGIEAWIAWVPFYNNWKLLELGGQHGFWSILSIVPIVNYVSAVFLYIAMYHVGIKFGKSGTFVLLAIFLPLVWVIWLAVDKSVFNDTLGTVRSKARGHDTSSASKA